MTEQEIYNKVKHHLLTQNAKSFGDQGCMYRGENQTACAVGCLIPDSKYRPDIETLMVSSLAVQDCLPFEVTAEIKSLLGCLQGIHDICDVSEWKIKLEDLAVEKGLKP